MSNDLVNKVSSILNKFDKPWVLFKNGTCFLSPNPEEDIIEQATDILKVRGAVQEGTKAGDFSTIKLEGHPGWIVTCHHPEIAT